VYLKNYAKMLTSDLLYIAFGFPRQNDVKWFSIRANKTS